MAVAEHNWLPSVHCLPTFESYWMPPIAFNVPKMKRLTEVNIRNTNTGLRWAADDYSEALSVLDYIDYSRFAHSGLFAKVIPHESSENCRCYYTPVLDGKAEEHETACQHIDSGIYRVSMETHFRDLET